MKFNRNSSLWTSTILHLVVFAVLFLATLFEALLPKEQPHVFEMVSEPSPNQTIPQNNSPAEMEPDFSLPEVQPLEIPETDIPDIVTPVRKPVGPPPASVNSAEQRITYEDFIKKNPKPLKTRTLQPSRPDIKIPTINTEKFGVNLQSSLTTADENTSNALTAAERTALQSYGDQLNHHLNSKWKKPDNLSGINLVATVVFDVSSSGYISNIRFSPSSGNALFDESVRAAFASLVSGGPTPTGQGHTFTMSFKIVN